MRRDAGDADGLPKLLLCKTGLLQLHAPSGLVVIGFRLAFATPRWSGAAGMAAHSGPLLRSPLHRIAEQPGEVSVLMGFFAVTEGDGDDARSGVRV